MLFTKNTKNILEISPCYSLITFTVKTINCVHHTGPSKEAICPAICYPHTWFFTKSGRCVTNGGCSSSSIDWKSIDCDILLSRQMLDAIITSLMTVLFLNKTLHQCILRSTQSNCCSAKLSTSFLVTYGPVTVQHIIPLTMRFKESSVWAWVASNKTEKIKPVTGWNLAMR